MKKLSVSFIMHSGFSKDESSLDITLISVDLFISGNNILCINGRCLDEPISSSSRTVLTFYFVFVFVFHFACCVFVRKG